MSAEYVSRALPRIFAPEQRGVFSDDAGMTKAYEIAIRKLREPSKYAEVFAARRLQSKAA